MTPFFNRLKLFLINTSNVVLLAREDLHWLAMLLFLNLKMVGRVSSTHLSDGSIELFNKNGNRMVYVTTDVEGKGSMSAYDYSGNRIGRVPQ